MIPGHFYIHKDAKDIFLQVVSVSPPFSEGYRLLTAHMWNIGFARPFPIRRGHPPSVFRVKGYDFHNGSWLPFKATVEATKEFRRKQKEKLGLTI